MTVGQHYRGTAGERYFAWQGHLSNAYLPVTVAKYSPFVSPESVVVDFGCGGGAVLESLTAATKVGIEPNEAARSRAQERGLLVVSSPADVADDFGDVVISNHALEHTLAPLSELREIRRILKPGGKFIFRVPVDDWRAQREPDPTDINHHLYTWTPLLLGHLLTEAGFKVEKVEVVTRALPPQLSFALRLPKRLFDALALTYATVKRRRELSAIAVNPDPA